MAKALKWKIKPVLTVLVVTLFLIGLVVKLFYDRHHASSTHTLHQFVERHVRDSASHGAVAELIKWNEPNGPYNPKDPGENGLPVLTKPEEEMLKNKAYAEYGFNQFISDKISLHRSLMDPRHPLCREKKYPSKMPTASVVIIFHNEGWSTLLRTVHTVLDRSPPELLHEIVLCDDFSIKPHLKQELENYVSNLQKVKVVRTHQREGLIRARTYGADHTSGDVIIFLDSHCEVNVGWLPPLLGEIATDYRTVVCPTIDFIDHNDFHYRGVDPYIRGTFNWRFDYKERGITIQQRQQRTDDTQGVLSPVMAGGLFAIHRTFWKELGKYDPGMYVWGGEQYELSFKLWMCGGRMLNMPCSRVGHVYRRNVPYTYDKPNAVLINFKRVAEVWMDDFKEFLYQRRPEIRGVAAGDLADRMEIKTRLQCKSFKWYLQNVANDTVRTKYEPDRAYGEIRNAKHKLCLDSMGRRAGQVIGLGPCHGMGGNQAFHWTYIYELRQNEEDCLDARYADKENVYVEKCHEMGGNQHFNYDEKSRQFKHDGTGLCLSTGSDPNPTHPAIEVCEGNRVEQQWIVKTNDMNQAIPEWAKFADQIS